MEAAELPATLPIDQQITRILLAARHQAASDLDQLLEQKLAQLHTEQRDAQACEEEGEGDATVRTLLARSRQLQEAHQVLVKQVWEPVDRACNRLSEAIEPLILRKQDNEKQLDAVSKKLLARRAAMMQGDNGLLGLLSKETAMSNAMDEATRTSMAQYTRRCDKIERELVVARNKALISRF